MWLLGICIVFSFCFCVPGSRYGPVPARPPGRTVLLTAAWLDELRSGIASLGRANRCLIRSTPRRGDSTASTSVTRATPASAWSRSWRAWLLPPPPWSPRCSPGPRPARPPGRAPPDPSAGIEYAAALPALLLDSRSTLGALHGVEEVVVSLAPVLRGEAAQVCQGQPGRRVRHRGHHGASSFPAGR